ncbi:MAG: barstar family protein [Lachnospiraceae bacterium]|nr:barstar family protein [Lachnospiraceae bacterium]
MQRSHSSTREIFYIDLTGADTPAAVQECLCRELPLPEYYGKNLDAFYDVLTSQGGDWELIFFRCVLLKARQPRYLQTLERLCREAAEETPGLIVKFFRS